MAELLLGDEPMVVEWDRAAGVYFVRGWTAGPAGTAGLRFAADVEADIDVAWPTRLTELRVPSGDGRIGDRAAVVVERLIGPSRLADLHAGARPIASPRPVAELEFGRRSREHAGVALACQRAALAAQIGDDASRSAVVRGVAFLEAASNLRRVGRGLGLRRQRETLTRSGADLLLAAAGKGGLDFDPGTAIDVAALVEGVVGSRLLDRPDADRLAAMAADLRQGRHDRRARADALSISAEAFAAAPRQTRALAPAPGPRPVVPVDRRSLPTSLVQAEVRAVRTTAAEVEVRVVSGATPAAGCWARAFDADGTLVALAPLQPAGADCGARLLVAPDTMRHIIVDVTDQPAVARPSAALVATQSAIAAGRIAAGHERAGHRTPAAIAWQRAAEHWQTAGDCDTRDDRPRVRERSSPTADGDAARPPRPSPARQRPSRTVGRIR